uniref:Uncharacterized protein n=1 Tax=Anguilla anguilla TaxID=7936 RepID=A0A0E9TI84_ANGAN
MSKSWSTYKFCQKHS